MNEAAPLLVSYQVIGAMLFGLGLIGFVARRNMIVMFLCVEIMLQGVSISFVSFGRYHQNWGGQMMVIFIIAVAAAEASIALALIMMLFQKGGTLDITYWQDLREEGQPPYVDHRVPEDRTITPDWPDLTPAGIRPEIDVDEQSHRTKV